MRIVEEKFEEFAEDAGLEIHRLKELDRFRDSTDGWWPFSASEQNTKVWQMSKLQSDLAKQLDETLLKCFENISKTREGIERKI